MSQNLQNRILKMNTEQLQKIIANSELYSSEAVELAKKQIEELEKLEKINAVIKAKFEAMTDEEKTQILKEPDLYNEDIVKLAKAYNNKFKHDFSSISEEAKAHLTSLSAEALMDMLNEKEEILSENIIAFIKHLIDEKLDTPQPDVLSTENQLNISDDSSYASTVSKPANEISVPGGQYSGKKYFLKVVYKTIETDVAFSNTGVELCQGSGFLSVKKKENFSIKYEDIQSVEVKRTMSVPSIVFSVLSAILFFVFPTLDTFLGVAIAIAVILFLGSNSIARIYHSGYMAYDITTDFKSEAIEAKDKIELALSQYKGENNKVSGNEGNENEQ